MKISPKKFKQKDQYSCTSCVLRYAIYLSQNKLISMRRANKLTLCKPDGTTYRRLQRVFQKFQFKTKKIKNTTNKILHYLEQGYMIVIDDLVTWKHVPHAILILEFKNNKLRIFDPSASIGIRIQSVERTIKRSSEAFIIRSKI